MLCVKVSIDEVQAGVGVGGDSRARTLGTDRRRR
jgi:hypothetical protein